MFDKVIIAEDVDSMNLGVVKTLEAFGISDPSHAQYCDDALLKIKKAIADKSPFDLLITDLSFKEDHRSVAIRSGAELIKTVREIQPGIRIIVLSVEDRPFRIKALFDDFGIDAYIVKGRRSMTELQSAISHINSTGDRFVSNEISHILSDKSFSEIEKYDEVLLKLLADGLSQEEISIRFQNTGITPNGTSSIEKRISRLKIYLKAANNVNLISIAKDMGLV